METERILNCVPSAGTEYDWTYADAYDTEALVGLPATAPNPPTKVDMRVPWWTVGDQGATGSCVGWAATDSLARWHMVYAKRIAPNVRLSIRYMWMAAKETDIFTGRPTSFIESDGTSLKAALDVLRKFGAVVENVLPFQPPKLYRGSAQTFYALASRLRIDAYFNLMHPDRATRFRNWRVWLAGTGPILTRLDVDDTWMKCTGPLKNYDPASARGGHAVAIVGYTPDAFIIRNSWGLGWGKNGFGLASLDYAAQAFTEAYGIQVH